MSCEEEVVLFIQQGGLGRDRDGEMGRGKWQKKGGWGSFCTIFWHIGGGG